MFVRCFCELNVCLDEYELFARPRVAGHYNIQRERKHCWELSIGKLTPLYLTAFPKEEIALDFERVQRWM